jgi:hypothetical protein
VSLTKKNPPTASQNYLGFTAKSLGMKMAPKFSGAVQPQDPPNPTEAVDEAKFFYINDEIPTKNNVFNKKRQHFTIRSSSPGQGPL